MHSIFFEKSMIWKVLDLLTRVTNDWFFIYSPVVKSCLMSFYFQLNFVGIFVIIVFIIECLLYHNKLAATACISFLLRLVHTLRECEKRSEFYAVVNCCFCVTSLVALTNSCRSHYVKYEPGFTEYIIGLHFIPFVNPFCVPYTVPWMRPVGLYRRCLPWN